MGLQLSRNKESIEKELAFLGSEERSLSGPFVCSAMGFGGLLDLLLVYEDHIRTWLVIVYICCIFYYLSSIALSGSSGLEIGQTSWFAVSTIVQTRIEAASI